MLLERDYSVVKFRGEPDRMKKIHVPKTVSAEKKMTVYFPILWLLCTVIFGIQILQKQHEFEFPGSFLNMLLLVICSISLMTQYAPSPLPKNALPENRNPLMLWGISLLLLLVLVLTKVFIGPSLLFGLPIIGGIVVLRHRTSIPAQEIGYVLILAGIAAGCGLGAQWISMNRLVWSALQFFLVMCGFLAGWCLLKQTDLSQYALGTSAYITDGIMPAVKGFGVGFLLSLPWALGNILFGASATWVQSWWQPLIALNPGIAEEAWSRMLLVPLLYLLLRRFSHTRHAFFLSTLIVGFWFSYLHMSHGLIEFVIMTPLMTIMYALTLSSLIFHRNLEMAIGFHVAIDFVKYFAALLMNHDIWF